MKKNMWWVASLLLALALVGQYVVYRSERPGVVAHGSWDFRPQNFDQVVAKAQTIVEGQVESIEAGQPIVVKAPGEPSGQDSIPTQNIRVRVQSNLKGAQGAGTDLTVFRTGADPNIPQGPQRTGPNDESRNNTQRSQAPSGAKPGPNSPAPPPPSAPAPDPNTPATATNARVFLLAEDPPYQVGQRVFLALEAGPNNTVRPVAPSGRYNIGASNRLEAVGDDPVSQSVNGRDVADARAAAAGTLHIPTNPGVQKRVTSGETGSLPGMPTTGVPEQMFLPLAVAGLAILAVVVGFVARRRKTQL